jgi:hypothetical protein
MVDETIEAIKPHVLYVVCLSGATDEIFNKIGVTKYDINTRFKNEKKYKVIDSVSFNCKTGLEARGVESLIIERIIRQEKIQYKPKQHLGGHTECFTNEGFGIIYNTIKKLLPNSKEEWSENEETYDIFEDDFYFFEYEDEFGVVHKPFTQ